MPHLKRPPCPRPRCRQVSRRRVRVLPTSPKKTQLYRCWDPECDIVHAPNLRTKEPGYAYLELKRIGEYAFFDTLTGEFLFTLYFKHLPQNMYDILGNLTRLPWLTALQDNLPRSSQPPAKLTNHETPK